MQWKMFIHLTLILFFISKCFECYHVRMTKFEGHCKDYPHTKAVLNTNLSDVQGEVYLSTTLNVTQQFTRMGKIFFKLSRCSTLTENESSCENLRNITLPKINLMVADKNSEWAQIMQYDPPLGDPVTPGIYKAASRQINMDNWHVIVAKGFWRVHTVIFEDRTNHVVLCVYSEGVIS